MRDLAESLAGVVDRFRHMTPEMGILRVSLLVAGLLAVVMVRSWTGQDVSGVLLVLTGLLLAATMVWPDSPAPGALLAVLGLWWLAAAAAEPWQHVTVVVLLAAVHIFAAHAGSAPSHAAMSPTASYTMLVGAGAYVVVAGLVTLLMAVVLPYGAVLASVPLALAAVVVLLVAVVGAVLVGSRS